MPTIRRCCIVGCLSNSRQHPQLQFFQFPKPENPFHKLWKQSCHASLSRILPFKKPVVCALHFHPQCIGGRRLTSSAVPSLRLEVPTNLKDVEQQAMVEEIERSRKCAYINAVVYEWLVRANMNLQLRGSITHGMIKEKADTAKQLIGSTTFVADNRWLNRFRETHLRGFAQKLGTNQLKPLGPSLWIPDIVQDLQHLFPPTSQMASFESMPEQYMDYMQQYGEYEEDDEPDIKDQSYQHAYQQQQQEQHQQQQQRFSHPGYDAYGQHQPPPSSYYNDDYYYQNGQHSNHASPTPQAQHRHSSYSSNPPSQQQSPVHRTSPYPGQLSVKRLKLKDEEEDTPSDKSVGAEPIEDLTSCPDVNYNDNGVDTATTNGNGNGNGNSNNSDNNSHHGSGSRSGSVHDNGNASDDNSNHRSNNNNNNNSSPKRNGTSPALSANADDDASTSAKCAMNGRVVDHSSTPSPTPSAKDLETYAQALEYLKPLEDFVLFKENFRAIGLISQLEAILRKGERNLAFEMHN